MNIVILNTNSFGGNYEYSRCLAKAYLVNKDVESCLVLIPENAAQEEDHLFKKVLISDHSPIKNKLFKKLYFLFRSVLNPIRTYQYLKKVPSSLVIFNDFEQISSFIWVPLFRKLKNKHHFTVILHDPDRDEYVPIKALSIYTMKRVMSIMNSALYHEVLPDREYYNRDIPKIKIPHGIYFHESFDKECLARLQSQKGDNFLIGILGNIREEKNYELVIDALTQVKKVKLLIAGNASSSKVSIEKYKQQINRLELEDRVIWLQKFMSDDEFQAAIKSCDVVLLYYKSTFTSQSGVLNLIAPHKKWIIVSDVPSALRETVKTFGLGSIVPLSLAALVSELNMMGKEERAGYEKAWMNYMNYASWDNHVQIVLDALKQKRI
jgi:glycosyltransferase involved in cell wall biosynthesis